MELSSDMTYAYGQIFFFTAIILASWFLPRYGASSSFKGPKRMDKVEDEYRLKIQEDVEMVEVTSDRPREKDSKVFTIEK